jgi:hypothetical protein
MKASLDDHWPCREDRRAETASVTKIRPRRGFFVFHSRIIAQSWLESPTKRRPTRSPRTKRRDSNISSRSASKQASRSKAGRSRACAPARRSSHFTPLNTASTHIQPDPTRTRKLLLHRGEIDRLTGLVERRGYTLVALELYWKQGKAKLSVGLAKGKKQHDKRATEKDRDWQRDKARLMKGQVAH